MSMTTWHAEMAYFEGHNDGYEDGIREGERRMLRSIVVGVEWWLHFDRFTSDFDRYRAIETQGRCLRALRGRGDEDASRVLGERGR